MWGWDFQACELPFMRVAGSIPSKGGLKSLVFAEIIIALSSKYPWAMHLSLIVGIVPTIS